MTKSVSKVLTTSTVVAAAATVINQVEALNDRPQHNRLRVLQEEGEDASASLSMPTNVESISNLMEEEEPKFVEKKEKMDIGVLMSSVMKNGEFAETVSQAFDEMGDWDKQDLVEKVDELVDLVKHLLHGSKSGKSKSGKGSKASGDVEGTCSFDGDTIGPFGDGSVSLFAGYGTCCEDSDCFNDAGGIYCGDEYVDDEGKSYGKQCYCSNYSAIGTVQPGDCCGGDINCASRNCDYTTYTCCLNDGGNGMGTEGECCTVDDDCVSGLTCVTDNPFQDPFCADTFNPEGI